MADVYISYKRRLRPRVVEIARRLESLGLSVWFDDGLLAGSGFADSVNQELRAAGSILVLWSDDAFPHGGDEHGWMRGEAEMGRRRGVLVAAMLEPTDLDPPWNMIHTADLSHFDVDGPDTPEWRGVVEAIARVLGRPDLVGGLSRSRAAEPLRVWRRDPPPETPPAKPAPRPSKVVATDRDEASDVFISYKRRTRKRVEVLAAALAEYGLSVWFDRSLRGGSRYEAVIAKELRRAGCVVVFWTDDAFEHGGDVDGYVTGEAKMGRKRKKLVPVLFEEDADLDPPFNNDQLIDLSKWDPDDPSGDRSEWQAVLEAIGGHVKRPGLADYDRARAEGAAALAQWAQDYPDDPLASGLSKAKA